MKFIIQKNILMEQLNNVSRAVSSKNLIPVLMGIKFEIKKKGIYLYASDSNISIKSFIDIKDITSIEEEFDFIINGKYIAEIVRKLPDANITFEMIDNYKILINCNNSEFSLNGTNPNEFPNIDLELTKEPVLLTPPVLKQIISQTVFATSQFEDRPVLTGINFKVEGKTLELIATDSYRLAYKKIELETEVEKLINIIVPGKNLLEFVKILTDDKEIIELHIFNNKVIFKYKNIVFLSRLLNGTYPTTSSVIPNEFTVSVSVNSQEFYEMIDRASLLTSDKDKNTIKSEIDNNKLIISSNSPEIGNVEEIMECECNNNISISFSSKYMLEAIKSFNSENIVLNIINDSSPIILKSETVPNLIQLILPIKTY